MPPQKIYIIRPDRSRSLQTSLEEVAAKSPRLCRVMMAFLPESIPATYFANFMTYGIGVAGLGESCRHIHLPAYQRILLWMRPGSQIRCIRISTFCLSY